MNLHFPQISRVVVTGTLAAACFLALSPEVEAKGPKGKSGKSEHSNGKKNGHYKNHEGNGNDDDRRVYLTRPRSVFRLSFGNGYRGQGYYYGPPNSRYYYESPDTRYYSDRNSVPQEYRSNLEYGRADNSSVQQELRRLGYYDGGIDGQIGPQSSRSIARYQRDQGLAETGNLDESLLQSLGLR